jgi:hypothetical protein
MSYTKGVTENRKSKDRQHNGNSLKKSIAQKTKDRATRTPLKFGSELMSSGRKSNSRPTCDTRKCCFKLPCHIHLFQSLISQNIILHIRNVHTMGEN